MSSPQCPLCFSSMEKQRVAPCMDCGHLPEELQHLQEGIHTYVELRAFGVATIVLCNFCCCDFNSYDPASFDVAPRKWKGSRHLEFVRSIDPPPQISYDYVCAECHRRLAWLDFLVKVREHHAEVHGQGANDRRNDNEA